MKLYEKIYFCRKEAGLSQDALAERLGVSRQAISKWENGEAVPETMKLPTLAKEFGVTVDWLLTEDAEPLERHQWEAAEETPAPEPENPPVQNAVPNTSIPGWVDDLPKSVGKLIRRFGWLAGAYVALGGAGITALGAIAKVVSNAMMRGVSSAMNSMGGINPFGGSMSGMMIYDQYGNPLDEATAEMLLDELNLSSGYGSVMPGLDGVSEIMSFNPVSMVAGFIMVIGVVMMVGGTILAVCLRKWGKTE